MRIKILLFCLFLAKELVAFDVSELPPISKRETPNISDTMVYSYANSIKEAKKGVVNISTQKRVKGANLQDHPLFNDPFFRQFFGDAFGQMLPRDRIERSLGSGVLISRDGYIVTNNHVIDGADKIIVALPDSNMEYEANVIGKDAKSDLAIIKIKANNLPFLRFALSNDVQVGDIVFAIGNPFGVGETITQGIVSALNKSGIGINDYENFIQTDASINPGNSGGALVDSRGGLIGINTAILSRTGGNHGVGFAIPSEMVKKIAKTLIEKGVIERGYLGVGIQDVNTDLKDVYTNQTGALVISIEKGSPAHKAGLAVWDLIIKINQTPIKSAAELKNIIGTFNPQEKIALTYIRDKKEYTTTLTLAKLNQDSKAKAQNTSGLSGLGITNISNNLRLQLGIPNDISGVYVTSVEPNSDAEMLGFNEGDIIMQIENSAIVDTKSFEAAIQKYRNKVKRMLINRQGRVFSIVVK